MKILVIGSGGREHARAWKFALSEKTEKVFVAPGNGGTALEAKCENIEISAHEELLQFALKEKISFTVVGPELPLAMGIVDRFRAAGLAIIGPDKKAAELEASKIYSKAFMAKYGVRTAASSDFTDASAALDYSRRYFSRGSAPLVIKADGLAAGKGVVIAQNFSDAESAIVSFMKDKSLGEAGNSVLLEEYLEGKEVSVLAAVSAVGGGAAILPFVSARDHKRRFDSGQGPNTGGMGAIAPVPDFTHAAQADFFESILTPTLNGIKAEALDYRGFIFFGLMVNNDKCYLLEYNVRLGDPETQAVLPLMDFDLVDLCGAILDGSAFSLKWKTGAVCAPVAVADGYPGSYRKGDAITVDMAALEKTGAKVFFAGAATDGSVLKTSGGRVLAVSAFGSNAENSRLCAYKGLEAISFQGMDYRRDIGREG
jgi:phosphoribosylamine--glycine ligase